MAKKACCKTAMKNFPTTLGAFKEPGHSKKKKKEAKEVHHTGILFFLKMKKYTSAARSTKKVSKSKLSFAGCVWYLTSYEARVTYEP